MVPPSVPGRGLLVTSEKRGEFRLKRRVEPDATIVNRLLRHPFLPFGDPTGAGYVGWSCPRAPHTVTLRGRFQMIGPAATPNASWCSPDPPTMPPVLTSSCPVDAEVSNDRARRGRRQGLQAPSVRRTPLARRQRTPPGRARPRRGTVRQGRPCRTTRRPRIKM